MTLWGSLSCLTSAEEEVEEGERTFCLPDMEGYLPLTTYAPRVHPRLGIAAVRFARRALVTYRVPSTPVTIFFGMLPPPAYTVCTVAESYSLLRCCRVTRIASRAKRRQNRGNNAQN